MTGSEGLGAVVGRARWLVPAVLASIALLVAAGSAQAATCDYTWGGSSNGDWMTAGNWAGGTVPSANSNVCIASGSAVLTDTSANAPHLASLTISGTGGLTVSIHQVLVSASTTIGPSASLTLNGTYNGANAGNASLGGGPVLNQGTITMEGTGYQATLYGTVTNQGTINVPFGAVQLGQGDNGGTGSFTNQGTINVAAPSPTYPHDPAQITAIGYPFTNASGTINNAGTFIVEGAGGVTGAFNQGNGSITGNAVNIISGNQGGRPSLAWTGTGPASFFVGNSAGAVPMSGNIAAGQSLTVAIGSGMEESGSFTNAGAITLNGNYPGCCGGAASIIIDSGSMTNTGSITATSNDVTTQFIGSVVNDGTITVTPGTELEQTTGSFINSASGTLVPEISSSALGAFVFDNGVSFTAGGALAPTLQGGFTPTVGQAFKVIAGSSLAGRFASVTNGFGADYSQTGAINAVYGKTTAPPPPPPPPHKSATAHVGKISGGGGKLTIKLSCPAGGHACATATITATIVEHLKRGRLTAVTARARARTRTVVIARARVMLPRRRQPHGDRDPEPHRQDAAGQARPARDARERHRQRQDTPPGDGHDHQAAAAQEMTPRIRRWMTCATALGCLLAFAPAAAATPPDYTWSGGAASTSVNWSNAGNWTGGGSAPTPGEPLGTIAFPQPTGCGSPCDALYSQNDVSGLTANALSVDDDGGYDISTAGSGIACRWRRRDHRRPGRPVNTATPDVTGRSRSPSPPTRPGRSPAPPDRPPTPAIWCSTPP